MMNQFPSHSGIYCNSYYAFLEAAPRQLFNLFAKRFVKEVQSRDKPAYTAKLHQNNAIPERVQSRRGAAEDNESANSILLDFLSHQSTNECLHTLLAIMTEADDHPTMSKLVREMSAALRLTAPVASPGRCCMGTI